MVSREKIYFPNLNGLRFIAASLVMIHHIEQFRTINKTENLWGGITSISLMGKLGVLLFFVLSGFLITYLLLTEEKETTRINIKQFYIRRALRIWPLYFLIISFAFLILPNIEIFQINGFDKDSLYSNLFWRLLLIALFLPSLSFYLFGIVPFASHTWSIGAEEQFYLVWPVLMRFVRKHKLWLLLTIIILYVGLRLFLESSFSIAIPYRHVIQAFWKSCPISCMAIGGVFSTLYFQKSGYLKYILTSSVFNLALIATSILMVTGVYIPFIHYEFYSVLFGLIILNFSVNEKLWISLENRVLNYLGTLSYGIYMFHPIAIISALTIGSNLNLETNWFLYPLSLLLTITIAAISYTYYESFFLKFKNRFSYKE